MCRSASLRKHQNQPIHQIIQNTKSYFMQNTKVLSLVDPDQFRQVAAHHIILPLYTFYSSTYTYVYTHYTRIDYIQPYIYLTRASKHPIYTLHTPYIHPTYTLHTRSGKSSDTAFTASSSSPSVGRRVNCAVWFRSRTGPAPCMGLKKTTKPFYMP